MKSADHCSCLLISAIMAATCASIKILRSKRSLRECKKELVGNLFGRYMSVVIPKITGGYEIFDLVSGCLPISGV
jgi:hypothetical protein